MAVSGRLSIGLRSTAAFVGRDPELDWLDDCVHEVLEGRPRLALISGEVGVGKTRLLKELCAWAGRDEFCACYGRGYENLAVPYLPIKEALVPLLGRASAAGPAAAELAPLLDGARGQKSRAGLRPAHPDAQSRLPGMSRAIIELVQAQPAMLVLDDAHWFDGASLALLSHLVFAVSDASARERVPLLIVCGYRPVGSDAELARAIARFQREEMCQTLELSGMDPAELRALFGELGIERPSHQLIDAIHQVTQGNPLFVQEALRQLTRQGALSDRGGYVAPAGLLAALDLPADLVAAVTARTSELSEPCQAALVLASFLADPFELETLGAISELLEKELIDLLEEAERNEVVVSVERGFQFAHPAIRSVFYHRFSLVRRRRTHSRIAATLEKLYADSLDEKILEVAHHLVEAGPAADPHRVAHVAQRAGDRAFSLFAWSDAAHYYAAALARSVGDAALSNEEKLELHYWTGLAHYKNMDPGPCLNHYERAIALCRGSGKLHALARVVLAKTKVQLTLAAGPFGSLIDIEPLQGLLDSLPDDETVLRSQIHSALSECYWVARDPRRAEEQARRALELGESTDDDRLLTAASHALALAQSQDLRVPEALESWERSLTSARRCGDLWLQAKQLQRQALHLPYVGRLDEAEEVARQAAELVESTHDFGDFSLAAASRVMVAAVRGDFEAAEARVAETLQMIQRSHYPWGATPALGALAYTRAMRGAWTEARDAIEILVEPGRVFDEPGRLTRLLAWTFGELIQAHSEMGADERKRVIAALSRTRDEAPGLGAMSTYCAAIELCDLLDAPEIVGAPRRAVSLAEERGILFTTGWVFLLPRVLGVAAALEERWTDAATHFERALQVAEATGAGPELARTRLDYARMLAGRGESTKAAELISQAIDGFAELAMAPFLERAEALAGRLGISVGGTPSADVGTLFTSQELQLLEQLARGREDERIADQLMLGTDTVSKAIGVILKKAGSSDRRALVEYAADIAAADARQLQPYATDETLAPSRTIMVTDMVGFTAMVQDLGDARGQQRMHTHNAEIRRCLGDHSATEITHTGDGIIASFASSHAALQCALAIQTAFADHCRTHPDEPIRVRIGLNAGEPLPEEGRLFGSAVNAASRICDRARPGQILVSEVVHQLAEGKGIHFTSRGRFALKGFPTRFKLYKVSKASTSH